MFDYSEFILENLWKAFINEDFTEAKTNIFLFNYLQKGDITQEDFDDFLERMENHEFNDEEELED